MSDTGTATAASPKPPSPVFSPAEAATYLGLPALGVKNPEDRIRYLVKKGRLRSIVLLGRMAFLREDLDRLLTDLQQEARRKER